MINPETKKIRIMPSKLKKAIGAVKDQTSISLAKVSNSSNNSANLEVTVLKATTHDVVPIEDKYVNEILILISSNKAYAAACATAIAKRVGKTRNWIVALKSLMLVLRIFQDGDPYFPVEVLHAMKRGAKILNLSNFRDDSNCPWDYTAFVRTFALYLDERLDCFLTGKLQRRVNYQKDRHDLATTILRTRRATNEPVRDMKPPMLLDRIHYWQKLLDRATATTPTGAAKTNRLVLTSLYAIVQETYDLYRDISDGLALLLDSFFHLQYQSCVNAFHACVKASKQFEDLSSFYALCKSLGVGRTSEYPSVQKVSEELLETLQEFLKDQASFPGRSPPHLQLPPPYPKDPISSDLQDQAEESEKGSLFGSACTSLEDLMSAADFNGTTSPSRSVVAEQEFYSSEEQQFDRKQSPLRGGSDYGSSNDLNQPTMNSNSSSCLDLVSFDEVPPPQPEKDIQNDQEDLKDIWELVLFESANQTAQNSSSMNDVDSWFQDSALISTQSQNNPFLQDLTTEAESFANTSNPTTNVNGPENFALDDLFSFPSTVAPTFCAQNSNEATTPPTFCAEEQKQSTGDDTLALTLFQPDSKQSTVTVAPTFCAQDPKQSTSDDTLALTLFQPDRKQSTMTVAPTFCAQQSTSDTTLALALCAQDTKHRTMAVAPTFCSHSTSDSATEPTFRAQGTNESTVAPTFCAQNLNESTMAPTFRAEIPNDPFTETPNFCATYNNDNWSTRGGALPDEKDDPFGTSETIMCNGLVNQESLLRQQRLWLEHQNKIIAKHLS